MHSGTSYSSGTQLSFLRVVPKSRKAHKLSAERDAKHINAANVNQSQQLWRSANANEDVLCLSLVGGGGVMVGRQLEHLHSLLR